MNKMEAQLSSAWGPNERNEGGFTLRWACEGTGFGEFTFVRDKDGIVRCDNECMGPDFIEEVFNQFIKGVKMDWEVQDGKMVYTRSSKPASEEDRQEIMKAIEEGKVDWK